MKKHTYVTYYLLLIAILFLISSTRGFFVSEVIIEWVLFLFLIGGVYVSNKVKAVWIIFYLFILSLFYNPFFLTFHNIQYTYVVDILIAVTFFFLALRWQTYAFEERM
ncbi:MAG: hypothetical protein WA061_00875 [Microgenomates group bacterium]